MDGSNGFRAWDIQFFTHQTADKKIRQAAQFAISKK
jgi:hypothetical protein